ncbi:MAG: hypothetical protein A2516_06140 [Alphaproteobacteria bacterium RIFOXYD12_FULL_60_8]|nr:MAG: hypothetical protein A2516_06140 [Alphaproteobacteria bacterium RIFOXYD12_FULL_60_8]
MARTRRGKERRPLDIWPGFVDALTTLLIQVIFLLLVFVLGQFFLAKTLSGRNAALDQLNLQLAEMSDLLELERASNAKLQASVSELSSELNKSTGEVERLSSELQAKGEEVGLLQHDVAALSALREELEKKVAELDRALSEGVGTLQVEKKASEEARAQAALLNKQMAALQKEVAALNKALDASEAEALASKAQVVDLGKRLNKALAGKVEELSKFRSDFFGTLRAILNDKEGVRIEGDRFVFQSEVLFSTGSAELGALGKEKLDSFAEALQQIAKEIPPEINWILRVDGHTDQVPIKTSRFPSNWELSAARALSVVNHLQSRGIPPNRLAAAGFGEHQPLDTSDSQRANRRNRRIELKLDQR